MDLWLFHKNGFQTLLLHMSDSKIYDDRSPHPSDHPHWPNPLVLYAACP